MKKIIFIFIFSIAFQILTHGQENIFGKNFEKKEFVPINDSILIAKYELTNFWYNKFLNDLKNNNPTALHTAMPDTTQWEKLSPLSKNYAESYHSNAQFQNYPVVNISYDAAVLFCNWLTEKYNQWDFRIYSKVQFRLPTEGEWLFAAKCNYTMMTYTWPGPYLVSGTGLRLCNYKYIGDEKISYNTENNTYTIIADSLDNMYKYSSITTAVNTFPPNDFGIYNMCGNAGEMIAEQGKYKGGHWNSTGYDVRIDKTATFSSASPFVGFRVLMEIKND